MDCPSKHGPYRRPEGSVAGFEPLRAFHRTILRFIGSLELPVPETFAHSVAQLFGSLLGVCSGTSGSLEVQNDGRGGCSTAA